MTSDNSCCSVWSVVSTVSPYFYQSSLLTFKYDGIMLLPLRNSVPLWQTLLFFLLYLFHAVGLLLLERWNMYHICIHTYHICTKTHPIFMPMYHVCTYF